MNDTLTFLLGEGKDLEWWQMSLRAMIMFFVALGLIRLSGRRSFGMGSPFDNVIAILLGAILSRAVVGASPMLSTIAAVLVLVVLHRVIAWLCIHYQWADRFFKGKPMLLFEQGHIRKDNLDRSLICEPDLQEELRMQANTDSWDGVEKATLERNGKISITKK